MKLKDQIDLAIKGKEILKVRYGNGTNAGKIRELLPRKIIDDRKFMAVCLATKQVKSFLFEKVVIVDIDEVVDYDSNVYQMSRQKKSSTEKKTEVFIPLNNDEESFFYKLFNYFKKSS